MNKRRKLPITSEKDSFFYSLSDITLSNLRATCPRLFQAFMIFIRTERSRDDMRALAQRMESCNCDRTDPVISEFHCWHWVDHATLSCQYPTQRRDDMESLITAIGSLLSTPIEASVWAAHASRVLSSPEFPSGWPFSSNDVFGPDPPKSATQLCRWLDEYPCFQLIHLLSYSFEDHAFDSTLLRSATLPRTIVRLLNRGLAALPADFAARSLLDRFDYKLPLSVMAAFMSRTEGIVDGVSLAYFYNDQAEPLLDVLSRIGRMQEGLNDILLNMMLTGTGGAVHATLVLPFDETRYHPHILMGSKQFKEKNISNACARPWQTTQNILYILTTRPMCSNPTCRNEFDAATWQRCTACRRVLYCLDSATDRVNRRISATRSPTRSADRIAFLRSDPYDPDHATGHGQAEGCPDH
ncbi:hypothetical protein BDZ89DRAFT_963012 [Hymenopellis radicata]|nr:hypothetical protein BDZ89DRAFT_963012 [Hymenopellis radicata]